MLDFLPSSIFSLSSSWSTPSGTSLERGNHCLDTHKQNIYTQVLNYVYSKVQYVKFKVKHALKVKINAQWNYYNIGMSAWSLEVKSCKNFLKSLIKRRNKFLVLLSAELLNAPWRKLTITVQTDSCRFFSLNLKANHKYLVTAQQTVT